MQTFLPYASFEQSAKVLDRQRLLKQRVETLQILYALTKEKYGFKHHPAVKQWKNYISALAEYGVYIDIECQNRGYQDHKQVGQRIKEFAKEKIVYPPYIGLETYHISHQSNLLRKDFQYYSEFFPSVPSDIPYFWPSKELEI